MAILQDYYRTLQVHPQAETDVIEAAYKRLAKKYHPDISELEDSIAREQMQLINQAYEVLKDGQKRANYHGQWQQNFAKVTSDGGQKPQQNAQQTIFTMEAMTTVKHYFEHLQNRRYQDAYNLLTKTDKQMVSITLFIRWQTAVSQIFALQNFSVQPGLNNFQDSEKSALTKQIIRVVVMTVDYNAIMERLEHDAFEKKVLREGKTWALVLGVTNVPKIIEHFEELAGLIHSKSTMKAYVDSYSKHDSLTGLLNKKGFLDEMEREAMRFMRYNRRFCLVMIGLEFKKIYTAEQLEELTHRMGELLKRCCRELDSIGRWRDQTFTILMPETDLRGGLLATQKLRRYLQTELLLTKNTQQNIFPAAVDVYAGDFAMAIDRLDFLYEASKKHKNLAIQSIRGAL